MASRVPDAMGGLHETVELVSVIVLYVLEL